MRVLLDHPNPFLLAHGGFQIQIQQTGAALKQAGLEVDYLRWWDEAQRGDVIHYFGRPPVAYVAAAQRKGIKVVLAQLLTGLGSRPRWLLPFQRAVTRLGRRVLPSMISAIFGWDAFRLVDACVANTAWEGRLMEYIFGAPHKKVHLVPNGVEEVFLNSPVAPRGQWLVCAATITERKRVLPLAQAAARAQTPLWVIGKPYAERDPYFQQFVRFVRENAPLLRYEGAVGDRAVLARVYREARGFVLLSTMETRSLAAEEAGACGCPLLLSDLPWARSVFGEKAWYCPAGPSVKRKAAVLRRFYDAAPGIEPPPKPMTWLEVGRTLAAIYRGLSR